MTSVYIVSYDLKGRILAKHHGYNAVRYCCVAVYLASTLNTYCNTVLNNAGSIVYVDYKTVKQHIIGVGIDTYKTTVEV